MYKLVCPESESCAHVDSLWDWTDDRADRNISVRLSLECHYDRPQATDLPPLGTNYCSPEFAGAMSTSGCSPNIAPASASSSAGAAHGTPLQTDDWVDPNLAAWLDMNHPDILTETAMVMAPSLDGILPASLLSLPDLPTCGER